MDGSVAGLAGLGVGWALYCALHSALIHPPVSDRLKAWLGRRAGLYRSAYNLFSFVALGPLAVAHLRLAGPSVIAWRGAWLAVPVLMNLAAAAFFVLGALAYGPSDFLGLASLREALGGRPAPQSEAFSTRGILRWVRHPWYTGTFLLLWGHDLDRAGLIASVVLTTYLFVGTRLEERKLVARFGEPYRTYQREVPMFVPRRPGK
jgi:methanethiol S-methyltransferase